MNQSYAIGIDVGGSSLKCGAVNRIGEIEYSTLISLRDADTEEKIIRRIVSAIEDCAVHTNGNIVGVGIGFPGIIDNNVVIGGADNLPGFENLPLGQILRELTGHHIVIDNDANLMGLGELSYGASKEFMDAIFLTVGTGIGGAIMIDGELYGGHKNRGAELGHIVIERNGLDCACGGKGCLEAYASVTSLVVFYNSLLNEPLDFIDGKYIVEKYHSQQPQAIMALQRHFDYLAAGITSFVNVFSPQIVVVGGGISESGQFYINELIKRVQTTAIPVARNNGTIAAATLGNKAGLLGCAANVFQKFKSIS